MQAIRFRSRWLLLLAALALVASACNGGGDGEAETGDEQAAPDAEGGTEATEGGGEETAAAGGEFSHYNCEPQSLIPQNSTEVCGGKVLDQLFTGLVEYDPETSEPINAVAESIESEDQITWTITIRDDFTFHDGEPVTAQSFADAWNFAVDPDAANQAATFFEIFEGYEEVTAGEAEELSGVTVVDDTTLEVTLTEPFSPFPLMVGYTAFYPLPSSAYEDMAAFEEAPVGNGRYQMDGSWVHDQEIAMTRYEDFPEDLEPGNADRIVWQIYNDINSAYLDVQAGNLDILDNIPPERQATVEDEFGDNLIETETSTFTYIGFPLYQEPFDDVNMRRAISMAIDRQPIIDAIFAGARTPASALIAPSLPEQHREDACEYCEFNPEEAQRLFEEAGGMEALGGPLTMYFNSGAGHEDWVEAVAQQLQQNLGIEDVQFESLEFAQYLDLHDQQQITGPFRLGWVLSYPSPQYAMEPLYTTGASSNYFGYSNPEVDDLLGQANAADTPEEADELYQQAEDQILEDMPLAPMWFETRTSVFTENVSNVIMDSRTYIRVERVQVNQ